MNWQHTFQLSLLSGGIFLASPAWAQGEPATLDFTAAQTILEQGIEDRAYPGCTVTVGTGDKVLWSAACGRFDYADGAAVEKTTIYDLASVTKVAGTTAVYMRLAALEKVQLDEPVGRHLPEFIATAATAEEKGRRERITLEHLLTHTAGLVSWKPFYKSTTSYAELLAAICATPLESEPGRNYRYSDPGMILAGEIAARLGGKPLVQLERELVFGPLQMTNTCRNPSERLHARIPPTERLPDTGEFVRGVVHDENARAGQGITGHAGLFATAEDLGKFAAEMLRGLEGRSQLFPKPVMEDFLRERDFDRRSHRTLGWGLTKNDSGSFGPAISHTGFTGTSMWLDPERRLYIVLLTNRVHPTRDNNRINRVRGELIAAVTTAFDAAVASAGQR
ncbi:MAG: beta-lactamase family protein [Verrucomicrobiae bacterium]|nr:beta-lactamase family protein [Verrucomicrobiae bacterium]